MSSSKLLITGCGASGTKFITELLHCAGLLVGHERIDQDGMASWYAAPGHKVSGKIPFNGHGLSDFRFPPQLILHQVRYPLGVISSASQAWSPKSWLYISKNIDISGTRNMVHAAMVYWLEWNALAKEISQHTYRVEELATLEGWDKFCRWIGHPDLLNRREELFSRVSTQTNSRKDTYKELTWRDLKFTDPGLTEDIQAQAVRWGYEVE